MDKAKTKELKQYAIDLRYVSYVVADYYVGRMDGMDDKETELRANTAFNEIATEIIPLIDDALARSDADKGELSDGYHTFNDLYHQRAILFAALCRAYKDKAWKSLKHSDGTMFDGDWFICGIETPQGQYTYHYKLTYWPLFAGKTLDNAPEWDGHTEDDVTRLMSLYPDDAIARIDSTPSTRATAEATQDKMICANCELFLKNYSQCTSGQQIADLAGAYDLPMSHECNIPSEFVAVKGVSHA